MQNSVSARFRTETALVGLMLLLLTSILNGQKKETPPREQIGEVFGKTVYRDEIPTGTSQKLHDKLQSLFLGPVFDQYHLKFKSKFQLTQSEIAILKSQYSKDIDLGQRIMYEENYYRRLLKRIETQLKLTTLTPTERRLLEQKLQKMRLEQKQDSTLGMLLMCSESEKFNRYLFKNYGGGRIRYLTMGTEAFDATHKWLEDQEKKGNFKITDPKLRIAFYRHWTDKVDIGPIKKDKKDIQKWLLDTEWSTATTPIN